MESFWTFVDFLFEKAIWWVLWGTIGLGFLIIIGDYLHQKITYRLYNKKEYYAYRKKMEYFDWNFNRKNSDRVLELMKDILCKEHNIILGEYDGYHFEFLENTFGANYYNITIVEEYGEGKILVKNVKIPETLLPRIEIYKAWF